MKQNLFLHIALTVMVVCIFNIVTAQQEVVIPFSGKQYHTDATAYREVASGRGSNISVAKSKAVLQATKGLASQINVVVDGVTTMIMKEVDNNGNMNFESQFSNLARSSVEEQLKGAAVVNEKVVQEGSIYNYWVVLELSKQKVIDGVYESITNVNNDVNDNVSNVKDDTNSMLQKLDLDKKRFEEIFNEEMRKFEEE